MRIKCVNRNCDNPAYLSNSKCNECYIKDNQEEEIYQYARDLPREYRDKAPVSPPLYVRGNLGPLPFSSRSEGLKYDGNKPRMDLIDADSLEEMAKVLTFGANKYSEHNWRKGISFSRLIGAAFRHLTALMRGEDKDPETGLHHAAHLMCCAMFLIWHSKFRPDMDDRWKPEQKENPDARNN